MIPVVLSGGAGTRLWPLSRVNLPKQYVEFMGESLMEKTLRRVSPLGSPWTITAAGLDALTARAYRTLKLPLHQIVCEPMSKNTAPALALLCRIFESKGWTDEIVGIFPADHLVTDEKAWREAIECARLAAEQGEVVTLGIRPTRPATGFGYIETTESVLQSANGIHTYRVRGFHEKPDHSTAVRYVEAKTFFWNAGIFVFRVSTMIGHFRQMMPELWSTMSELAADLGNLQEIYAKSPSVSIDYGIMERLAQQACVPCDIGWSDLGSWDDVATQDIPLENAAVVLERAGASGNFAYATEKKVFGLVGVENLIVVDTADAILIVRKGQTQDVRSVVDELKKIGDSTASDHRFELRPWGRFTVLRDETHFKSKIIIVDSAAQISYQSHSQRAEHWIFVKGNGEVVLNDKTIAVRAGDSVFIPLGAKHRVRNTGNEALEFVEVQTGTYFGEDDIQRFQDDYNRV